jgi:hypothetical protein
VGLRLGGEVGVSVTGDAVGLRLGAEVGIG